MNNKNQTKQAIKTIICEVFALAFTPLPSLAQLPLSVPIAPNNQRRNVPNLQMTFPPPSNPQIVNPSGIKLEENPTRREPSYILGPGDRLKLDVSEVPEYTTEIQVLIDGSVNLPGIGSVQVQGLTLPQAALVIKTRYSRLLVDPQVNLNILSFRPMTLIVAGEVSKPGTYSVTLAEAKQFPRLTQALTLAGGITQVADIRFVQVRRKSPTNEEVFTLNLWEMLNAGDASQDLILRDGDTIFVPTIADVDLTQNRQLADVSFASPLVKPINVVIVGEVARPGAYSVSGGGGERGQSSIAVNISSTGSGGNNTFPTVTRALQIAGGITPIADIRKIMVKRLARNGETRLANINLWQLLQSGDATQDMILQDGDTIIVPTATEIDLNESQKQADASFSPNAIVINIVGEVIRPGAISVPPNIPLNQVILAAGGFNPARARDSKVELIRLNRNGTVSKRTVGINFGLGVNEKNNPPLRNNDVIVVRRNMWTKIADGVNTYLTPIATVLSTVTNTVAVYKLLFPEDTTNNTNTNTNPEDKPPEKYQPQMISPSIVNPQITNSPPNQNPNNNQNGGIVSPQLPRPNNPDNAGGKKPQIVAPVVAPQISTPPNPNQPQPGINNPNIVAPTFNSSPNQPNKPNNNSPQILPPQISIPSTPKPNTPNSGIINPNISIPQQPNQGNQNNSGIINPIITIPQKPNQGNQNNSGIINPNISIPQQPNQGNQNNTGIVNPNINIPTTNNPNLTGPEVTTPQLTLPGLLTPELTIPQTNNQ